MGYARGRKPTPIYLYDQECKLVLTFATKIECEKYFGLTKGNLFTGNDSFREMDCGWYISNKKMTANELKEAIFFHNSKFCKKISTDKPIEIYNALGEKIGEFRSFRELTEIGKIPYGTLYHSYITDTTKTKRKKRKELTFKLKSNE